jgi:transcriptional regulator with XRE-family HTH domain
MAERHELGGVLRGWRERLQPAAAGLSGSGGQRRSPGLRREELAALASVSPDYIKRLEQGRARPSPAVLDSLARALRLTRAEYEYFCVLAGQAATRTGQVPRHIGPGAQRLLDRLTDVPAAVYDAAWTMLACNASWAALLGDPAGLPDRYRRGDADEAFARAAHLVRQDYTMSGQRQHPIELAATTASWDGDQLTLWETTQGLTMTQWNTSDALGIPPKYIRVISHYLGGGFGCKGSAWPHTWLVAQAADRHPARQDLGHLAVRRLRRAELHHRPDDVRLPERRDQLPARPHQRDDPGLHARRRRKQRLLRGGKRAGRAGL